MFRENPFAQGEEDKAQQPGKTDQGSEDKPKPDVPITVKTTTCFLKEAKISKPRISTAQASELLVTVSAPENARECHDTVSIDAPNFGTGKEATQSISVVRPKESKTAHWILDANEPGRWDIAVETREDRAVVPVAVTTPLGFPAVWMQAGSLIVGATGVITAILGLLLRGR